MQYSSFMGHEQHTLRFLCVYVCVCVCVCVCPATQTNLQTCIYTLHTRSSNTPRYWTNLKERVQRPRNVWTEFCVQLFDSDMCAIQGLSEILKCRLYAYRHLLKYIVRQKYEYIPRNCIENWNFSDYNSVNHVVVVKHFEVYKNRYCGPQDTDLTKGHNASVFKWPYHD